MGLRRLMQRYTKLYGDVRGAMEVYYHAQVHSRNPDDLMIYSDRVFVTWHDFQAGVPNFFQRFFTPLEISKTLEEGISTEEINRIVNNSKSRRISS
ncbi:MAG: hypothetical protein M1165_01530 [Candidatus Pacearchaeota archaeon]|nr:hypothetical protein [Candidatus Pacearchaeota archaeon]MDE1848976.1 hypothetical protein [Nanoarchaeota archaeon]